jgi:crotonobetainyl-CoA:carnitine CoA-transferase CaiB-like acyl-CoA transferase
VRRERRVKNGVCLSYPLEDVFHDPHVQHRQMLVEHQTAEFGTVRQVGFGLKLSDTPG